MFRLQICWIRIHPETDLVQQTHICQMFKIKTETFSNEFMNERVTVGLKYRHVVLEDCGKPSPVMFDVGQRNAGRCSCLETPPLGS